MGDNQPPLVPSTMQCRDMSVVFGIFTQYTIHYPSNNSIVIALIVVYCTVMYRQAEEDPDIGR